MRKTKLRDAPAGVDWDRDYDGFLLGEDDNGRAWLPTWRWRSDAFAEGGERRWGRPFNPWNPLHWARWLNTLRRRALVYLERV